MTSRESFHQAYEAFRELPYPDYPQTEELRGWNSYLLTLDGWIAGYATQIENGTMTAAEVPAVDDLISKVDSLRRDLDALGSQIGAEKQLLRQYRFYVSALHRLIVEISALTSSRDG